LESTRPGGRPRNRWKDEVREDGRIVGEEEWQEIVYNRQEWKKLLGMARNHCILHMAMEQINEWSLKISTYHLLEQNIIIFQCSGQHHRLLIMYIIIQGPVNQQILFIPNVSGNSGQS
jgi:hypothetical protein